MGSIFNKSAWGLLLLLSACFNPWDPNQNPAWNQPPDPSGPAYKGVNLYNCTTTKAYTIFTRVGNGAWNPGSSDLNAMFPGNECHDASNWPLFIGFGSPGVWNVRAVEQNNGCNSSIPEGAQVCIFHEFFYNQSATGPITTEDITTPGP